MLVPALGTDDAKPRVTRGNNQTTRHPRTPRSPSRAQDHVRTVKEHSISFLTSPAPSYMPLGAADVLARRRRWRGERGPGDCAGLVDDERDLSLIRLGSVRC